MLFRAASQLATPEYIWAFLESENTYRLAVKMAGGSAAPHLNVGDIKEFPTMIPPLPLQQKFAHIVQKYQRLRAEQREAERQAEYLFQTLLHQAFQGELELEDGTGDMPEEETLHTNVPGIPYVLTAPTKLVAEEAGQLALPME